MGCIGQCIMDVMPPISSLNIIPKRTAVDSIVSGQKWWNRVSAEGQIAIPFTFRNALIREARGDLFCNMTRRHVVTRNPSEI